MTREEFENILVEDFNRFKYCKDLIDSMKYLLERTQDKKYRKQIKTAITLIEKSTFEF